MTCSWTTLDCCKSIITFCLLFAFCIASAPGEDKPFQEIEKLFSEQNYEDALAKLDEMLLEHPNNAEAHAWKGNVLGALSEQAKDMMQMAQYGMGAMQAFETAVNLDPNNITGRFGRGIANLMAPAPFGNIDVALADLKKVVELDADHVEGYYFLGVAYQKKGEIDNAKAAFERTLDLNPDHADAKTALEKLGVKVAIAPKASDTRREQAIAFTHVTVIDATGTAPKSNMTVVIDNNRIQAIGKTGSTAIPDGTQVIDASDKFLIPGLWDMHIHIIGEPSWFFPLFIANGVTGVRYMGGSVLPEQWRSIKAQIAEGAILGPRVVAAGPIIDGPKPIWPGSIGVSNEDEARTAVVDLKKREADFVKVYSLISRVAYFAIADEARKQEIPFCGHVPLSVTASEATRAGQRTIEHLDGVLVGCSAKEDEIRNTQEVGNAPNPSEFEQIIASYSDEKAEALFADFVQNNTWHIPTLSTYRAFVLRTDTTFTDDERRKYIPPLLMEFFNWRYEDMSAFESRNGNQEFRQELMDRLLELVDAMHNAGVTFMSGTDAPVPHCYPGFTLHDELKLFVEAGLTPMEALQTATLNPAKFLNLQDTLGTVEVGKTADLVLLEANPLEDIGNTTRIAGVVVGGRFITKSSLQTMLEELEERVTASGGDESAP